MFEAVNREVPFNGLRWFFDPAETITERKIERVKALGGGIAVQHRMAFQGEHFVDRYGQQAAKHTPPRAASICKSGAYSAKRCREFRLVSLREGMAS